jgi:hypothetical protein
MSKHNLIGRRFGRLVVELRSESKVFPSGQKQPQYVCLCDCGQTTIVLARNLVSGNTKSCGCLAVDTRTKHQHYGDVVYKAWDNMRSRCYNTNIPQYEGWWGRGITVCDEWKNDFQVFYDYVSKLPHFGEEGYSLDRIDNDGNYEPGNVRWATRFEQTHNRRCSKNEYKG